MYELLHTVGFEHEMSRRDRDQYIIINRQNIQPKLKFAFDYSDQSFGRQDILKYDYLSIMHYPKNAFSLNNNPNLIQTKQPEFQDKIGNRANFSQVDLHMIKLLYKC